ncbi:hypothetical protein [Rathayibacter festucae]|uniref:Uncharacterized protein n=1 Tax=Rathayibacter festucae DSM 15932 TaxID=1328866 RepID=A0A3Q9UVG0_9MICO|nr:hypothetical protein [Rathayibacter festucae]AZZ51426.1 hypothetical protein C1I64_04795 [Rathayibacter festucae DSM 15932]
MEFLAWLITPAVVATILFGVLPYYDAGTRWTRRIKSDITIASGLPDGHEKEMLEQSVVEQAERLRVYRKAFTPGSLVLKWLVLTFAAATTGLLIAYPPINSGDEEYPFGPADYMMMFTGFMILVLVVALIGSGHDVHGRDPEQMIAAARARRHRKRTAKLTKLDKLRAERIKAGHGMKPNGSRLGFSTQVDPLANCVSTWEMLYISQFSGWGAGGLADDAYSSLREKERTARAAEYASAKANSAPKKRKGLFGR